MCPPGQGPGRGGGNVSEETCVTSHPRMGVRYRVRRHRTDRVSPNYQG